MLFKRYIVLVLAIVLSLSCVGPATGEPFILDDFEYWDSPYNHGWMSSDYPFPVMGYGVGYGSCFTQLDPGEGSRVLVVQSRPTVFNQLQPYHIARYLRQNQSNNQVPTQPVLSYKIRALFSIESFNQVWCYLLVKTEEDEWLWLGYVPVEGNGPKILGDFLPFSSRLLPPWPEASIPRTCLGYPLGRGIQDSTWHVVVRNLQDDLDQAAEDGLLSGLQHLEGVYGIVFAGNQFSIDEIMFLEDQSAYENHHPFIWDPGVQWATLFEPFELILHASDPEHDELSFDLKVGGWGRYGAGTHITLEPLPCDPNDPLAPYICARAALRFTPQVMEDLMLTVTVSDQYTSDITIIPLSVVNFHVDNHPPVIQRSGSTSKWVGYVNEPFTYQVTAIDQDGDCLTYMAMINGLPSYQYGPWQEPLINPQTGLVRFIPHFEGNFEVTVLVRDGKGALSITSWDLFVVNRGTWLNHFPVRVVNIKSPQLARAGNFFTVATGFVDPDGDTLYYSANIGSVTSDGAYSFLTYFPGRYQITITAYDIRGGAATLHFLLDVQPWWSY